VAVRDGVLTVAAERAAWATEARRHQAGLLAAAGRRAGVRVTRLRVVVRPRPGPAEGPGSHRTGAPGG
jgi:predicted nucleic acid-binding Zn ribbon protein